MKALFTLFIYFFIIQITFGQELVFRPLDTSAVYKVVEEMPCMPGCEAVNGFRERRDCSIEKLRPFFIVNLQYPQKAKENKVEDTVIIAFLINKDGSIQNPSVSQSIDENLDQEALRFVNLMLKKDLRWTPGKQRGQLVKVLYKLPVVFKL